MLLKNKSAVIYGAGGAIGGAVARAFAAEGATLYLAGRTQAKLDAIARSINDSGGKASTGQLDALDEQSVNSFLDRIVRETGGIDISFNAIGINDVQGAPLITMKYDQFAAPIRNAMASHFITATAVAKHMIKKGTGVILAITANVARKPYTNSGGFGVACAAIEGFCRQLAVETGRSGVRVICLRSAGSPDAPGVSEALDQHAQAEGVSRETFEYRFAESTMLKRLPLLKEIASAAVLMASDRASAVTAAVLNVTCGELAD